MKIQSQTIMHVKDKERYMLQVIYIKKDMTKKRQAEVIKKATRKRESKSSSQSKQR